MLSFEFKKAKPVSFFANCILILETLKSNIMKSHFILLFLMSFTLSLKAEVKEYSTIIYFNTDEFKLAETEQRKIIDFLKCFEVGSNIEIKIYGHTDNMGSIEYNKELSYNRANEVYQFLYSHGLKKELFEIDYYGEKKPVKSNMSEVNRASNRRVEVFVKTYYFNSLTELHENLKLGSEQVFSINPAQENLICGRDGVKIFLEKETFIDEYGNIVNSPVTLTLVEAVKFEDFIKNNLTTICDEKLIESGGMFKLEAFTSEDKKLRVNKPFIISVPSSKRENNMLVFNSSNGQNWQNTNQRISNKLQVKLPEYPKKAYVKYPEYDETPKPAYPVAPTKPRAPHTPKVESYKPDVKWYQFYKAEKIKKKYDERYLKAMQSYQIRDEKYDLRYSRYQSQLLMYKKNCLDYPQKLKEWYAYNEIAKENFKNSEEYLAAAEMEKIAQNDYAKRIAAWKNIRFEKLGEEAKILEKMGLVDNQFLNNYIFSFNQLGWINCDRFYSVPQNELVDITIIDTDTLEEKVLIVFKNINSMMSAYKTSKNGNYKVSRVPLNTKKDVFAYKVIKGKPYLCLQTINSEETVLDLKFKESSFVEIKKQLEEFNRST